MIVYSYQFSRGRVRLLLILRELPELDRALRPLDLLATLTMRDTPYLDSESNKEVCRLAAGHNNRRGIRHVRKRAGPTDERCKDPTRKLDVGEFVIGALRKK